MFDQLLIPLSYLGADLSDAVGPFIRFWVLIGMFIAIMLPIFAIPYIFIKMGSVAGQVQAKISNSTRNARRSAAGAAKGYAKREGKAAAGRAWQNKSAQWAARNDGSLKSKVGGYKSQRDFRRKSASESAERAQREAVMGRVMNDPRYAQRAAGVGGQEAVTRLQAASLAHEHEESRKRIAATQQLFSHEEAQITAKGGGFNETLQMYDRKYAEAAAAGDHETASAVLKQVHFKGSPGREAAANMLQTHAVQGAEAQKKVEETVYQDLSLASRSDIVKGEMGSDGKWIAKEVSKLSTEQKASLDGAVLQRAIQGGQVSKEEAHRIVTTNLKDKVENAALVSQLEKIAGVTPTVNVTVNTPAGTTTTPGGLVVPHQQQASQGPTPPTSTQQQRQQGGNFNGGPGQGPTPPTP